MLIWSAAAMRRMTPALQFSAETLLFARSLTVLYGTAEVFARRYKDTFLFFQVVFQHFFKSFIFYIITIYRYTVKAEKIEICFCLRLQARIYFGEMNFRCRPVFFLLYYESVVNRQTDGDGPGHLLLPPCGNSPCDCMIRYQKEMRCPV